MSPRRSRAAQDGQPIPLADLGQAGVVGQGLPEVVAGVPAQAEAVGHDPQKLPPRAEALEEEVVGGHEVVERHGGERAFLAPWSPAWPPSSPRPVARLEEGIYPPRAPVFNGEGRY
ncbi:MAG: hypothetical protein M3Q65_15660 [Chloroflexota bacterium]|nr:hypothetical protein [Chloroflexota bacterium]